MNLVNTSFSRFFPFVVMVVFQLLVLKSSALAENKLFVSSTTPIITTFSPTTVWPGESITINGSGFETTAANNYVFVGRIRATVTAATATSLTFTVPTNAISDFIELYNVNGFTKSPVQLMVKLPVSGNLSWDFFESQQAVSTWNYFHIGEAVDYDGDGKQDLVYSHGGGGEHVVVLHNQSSTSTRSFSATAYNVVYAPKDFRISDLNSDGKPDIVIGSSDQRVGFLVNTSTTGNISSSYQEYDYSFASGATSSNKIRVSDLDRDGKQDLITIQRMNASFGVHRNTSTSSTFTFDYTAFTQNSPLLYFVEVDVADLDGDGLDDIILLDSNGQIIVRRNTSTVGSISFAAPVIYNPGIMTLNQLAVGDFNNDGKVDLVALGANYVMITNNSTSGTISLTLDDEFLTFMPNTDGKATVSDIDGDGKLDIFHAARDGSLLRNTSSGGTISFSLTQSFVNIRGAVIGKFNEDALPDVAWASGNSVQTMVMKNSALVGMTLSATSFAYGNVNVGHIQRDSVLVTNNGGGELNISSISSSNSQVVPSVSSLVVPGGESRYLPFTLFYETIGTHSPTLTLVSNSGTNRTISTSFTVQYAQGSDSGNAYSVSPSSGNLLRNELILSTTTNLTIEGWFKANTVTGSNRLLAYIGNTGLNGFGIYLNTSGIIQILLGGKAIVASTRTMPVNEWTHIALTRGASAWTLYVDGEDVGISSTENPNTPTGTTQIGSRFDGGERFSGLIDEVRFWSVERTRTNIRNSYSSRGGNDTGLNAYYRFDHSFAGKTLDYSGNGRALTSTGSTSFVESDAYIGTPGNITFSVSNISFGNVIVGQSSSSTVTLSNPGSGIFHYEIFGADAAPFTKTATELAVKPGLPKTVTFTYSPTATGSASSGLGYRRQDGSAIFSLTMSGNGVVSAPSSAIRALSFDGTDDTIEILDATDPTAYTHEVWVKFNSITPGVAQTILTRTSASGVQTHHSHSLSINATGVFTHYVYFDQVASATITGTTVVQTGKWYHVAVTAQNSGQMRLFVNGVEEGTAQNVQTMWTGGDRWVVGTGFALPENSNFFNGELDEIRMWNTVRTPEQIRSNYTPIAGNATGLARIFRFDEPTNTGVSTIDGTGSGISGILRNGVSRINSTAPITSPVAVLSDFAFGNVDVSAALTLNRYLKNTGGGILNVSLSTDNTVYTVSPSSVAVTAGDSSQITVEFSPTAMGAVNAQLNASGNVVFTKSLSGTGLLAVLSTVESVNFGNVLTGTIETDSITIQNSGNKTLTISVSSSNTSRFPVAQASLSVPANSSRKLALRFDASVAGTFTANYILANNSATSSVQMQVSGVSASPTTELSQSSLTFGNILASETKKDSLYVRNESVVPLTISSIASNSTRFTVSPTSGTVSADDSLKVVITFNPNGTTGNLAGTVTVTHNGSSGSDQITVSGTALPAAATTNPASAYIGNRYISQHSYWEHPYTPVLNPSDNFTYEVWAFTIGSSPNFQAVFSSAEDAKGISIYLRPSGQWMIQFFNGIEVIELLGPNANRNVWSHLAAVYSEGSMKFYINGKLVNSITTTYVANTVSNFRIGQNSIDSGRFYIYEGHIDEVRVWNVARTQAQLVESMTSSIPGTSSGLVGYWRFDEANGSKSSVDLSASGFTLSAVGNAQTSTSMRAPLFSGEALFPTVIDFGSREIGQNHDVKQWIKNYGGGSLSITGFTASGSHYSIVPSTATIAAGDSLELAYHYTPSSFDNQNGWVQVLTNSTGVTNNHTSLYGRGQLTVFEPLSTEISNSRNAKVFTPDINADGLADILLIGRNPSTFANEYQFFENQGNFEFQPVSISGLDLNYFTSDIGDINNDGHFDVVSVTSGGQLRIYRNNGDNTFTNIGFYIGSNANNPTLTLGDYNNDGLLDIFLSAQSGSALSLLYKNTGSGFVNSGLTFNVLTNGGKRIIDFDGDGWNDIVQWGNLMSDFNSYQLNFYKNNGDATFSLLTHSIPPTYMGWLDFSDVNADGRLDFLLTGRRSDYSSRLDVFTLNEDNTFSQYATLPGFSAAKAAFLDANSDGYPDIVSMGGTPSSSYILSVFLNNQSGGFNQVQILTGLYNPDISVSDFNNDGKVDVLATGATNGTPHSTKIWRNLSEDSNTAPAVPTNLRTEFDGEHIILRWDSSTDSEGGPIQYNVRVGSSSVQWNRVRPLDSKSNKFFANASNKTNYIIPSVFLNEHFFWSVQAVDAGFKSSNYSAEQSVSEFATATINGNTEGWRLISSPAPGTTFAELLDEIWTQGATGADVPTGSPNVYLYNESVAQWQALTDLSQVMEMGRGYAVYVYAQNEYNNPTSVVWPKKLRSSKKANLSDKSISIPFTEGVTNAGFNLVGNPYPFAIDMESSTGYTRNSVNPVHYIWNPELGNYAFYTSGTQISGNGGNRYIAAYQGFWLSTESESTEFVLNKTARYSGNAVLLKEQEQPLMITLAVTNGHQYDETSIRIAEESLGFNIYQLNPMSTEYAMLFGITETNKKIDFIEVTHQVSHHSVSVFAEATPTDSLSFTWPVLQGVPENWDLILETPTAELINMRTVSNWTWLSLDNFKNRPTSDSLRYYPNSLMENTIQLKFTLHVGNGIATSLELENRGIPTQVELNQNYPNPFNPSTTIEFGLPKTSLVTVEIFDITGKKVSELLNTVKSAGWHQLRFDASKLSSGLYVYRVMSENSVQTRKMILIK